MTGPQREACEGRSLPSPRAQDASTDPDSKTRSVLTHAPLVVAERCPPDSSDLGVLRAHHVGTAGERERKYRHWSENLFSDHAVVYKFRLTPGKQPSHSMAKLAARTNSQALSGEVRRSSHSFFSSSRYLNSFS